MSGTKPETSCKDITGHVSRFCLNTCLHRPTDSSQRTQPLNNKRVNEIMIKTEQVTCYTGSERIDFTIPYIFMTV